MTQNTFYMLNIKHTDEKLVSGSDHCQWYNVSTGVKPTSTLSVAITLVLV